mmetsp:Transcript_16333/g.39461  ORF Transcript_16333/g.39461 Transcript_16333/m.39461 type:complete len:289 (+) Transcript_16333:117-983(+)|eukprot:CAMPEP_0180154350 /NCGR_PEP_ID=MMETSP0986-20121125/24111_1 /TAXON_ID=697907 /ORGANISM="non described non described, Strain CCMP2293" /LENGTH=288 /DNA_ID=CAMNT_0022102697 /DNA_START=105 /DNA_END=971 /DNA_ORIENTATION=-
MPPITQSEMNQWTEDYQESMTAPQDWNRLKGLMSKRVTVHMPAEPTMKKFEDWQKKCQDFWKNFKNMKRNIPKGVNVGVMPGKKDEVDCVIPELVNFTYTKELQEMYPNVNLASGEKTKMFVYTKLTLNSKKECLEMKPIFTPTAFLNDTRQFDDDGFVDKLYQDWQEEKLAEEVKCSFPGVPKQDKAALLALMAKFKDCSRELVKGCPTVTMPSGKDDTSEAMAHVSYKFNWDASLNEMFKTDLAEGAAVEIKSYDTIKIKAGKVVEFHMLFNPATNIKPAGKSGGN